jgi:hypothetical protein
VSIRHLKAVHTATHPGRLVKDGLDESLEPLEDDLLALLERETEDEA